MPLSSDLYDIADYINQIKKDYIPEDESTLILGIFGYLGDILTKTTQNNIIMSAETSNEGIGIMAKYEKNIIAHAFTAGINNIYAVPSTMSVLMVFNEAELFPESQETTQRFVFDSNNKIFFGDYEFHPDYNIMITKTRLNSNTSTGESRYAYSAQYYIESDSRDNKKKNPISNITDSNIYLSPPSTIRNGDLKLIYIQVPIRQVERYIINKKIVTNNIIESKVFSFDYSSQLAGFTVDIVKADGTNLRLVPVYDGISTDEKYYLYYQFMNTNFIRCKFIDSIYQPNINDQIFINLQTSQGYSGNFYWNNESYPRFVFDSTQYGLMNEDGSFDGYGSINCQIIPVSTEASGGLDKKSISELKNIIAKEELARNSITSLTDLKNFFNQINTDETQIYTYKKRDNQFDRLYYGYLLMKNSLSNIIPTNTIEFNVYENANNLSPDGTVVNVNKNDIIEYKFTRSEQGLITTSGEIIQDSVDPDMFGSNLNTLSAGTLPNHKSGIYYIKKIGSTWKFFGTDSTYTTDLSDISSLDSIGIYYDGVSDTLVVNYNYSYNAAVDASLPEGVTFSVDNDTFKTAVNGIEGNYNFLYTKYVSSSSYTKSGAGITDVKIDNPTLSHRLNIEDPSATQTFIFTFDATINSWKIGSTVVDIIDYGVTPIGSFSDGNTITVTAVVNTGWTLNYSPVDLDDYGITLTDLPFSIGNRMLITFSYNTNYAYVDKSTTAFFVDDIVINVNKYRTAVNDSINTKQFTYLTSDSNKGAQDFLDHIDNDDYYLIKYTSNNENAGGIIASDVHLDSANGGNRTTFFKSIHVIGVNDDQQLVINQFNEGTYKYICREVSDVSGVNIGSSTWEDLQSGEMFTFATGDGSSTLITERGINIIIDDYQVPFGSMLYKNSSCTTEADSKIDVYDKTTHQSLNTFKLVKDGNTYYFIYDSATYYASPIDVEIGYNRSLKQGDTIEIAFTLWYTNENGLQKWCNLDDYGINLINSSPSPCDTLTTKLHMSSMEVEKDKSLFYYECPYDITINKNPLIAYYKLSTFDIEKQLNFNFINNEAVFQFISSSVDIHRSYINNKNIYTITVKAKLNVEEDTELITVYGDKIVESKIKCILWLYNAYDDTTPSRYTFANLVSYNDNDFIFTYEFKLETDNLINEDNKISITSKELYVSGTNNNSGQYFDNNIKAEIVFAFDSSATGSIETTQALYDIVPSLSGYIMANSYYVNDGLDLFFNFSSLINSKVVAYENTNIPPIYEVPSGTHYYTSPYSIAASGKTYYSDAEFTTSAGTLTEDTKVYRDIDDNYCINIIVGDVITVYYVKSVDVTYVYMYKIPSGKTYYSNPECTTTAGTTAAETGVVVIYNNSLLYTINVGGTDYYVKLSDLTVNSSFIDPDFAQGYTVNDYSSESTEYKVFYDSTNEVCIIRTPSPTNSIYYVDKEDMNTYKKYYYSLNEIPCIRHGYINNEDIALEFLKKIISEKNYLEYCVSVIEDNFSIDFKFFNTYGPSRLYATNPNGTGIIDKVNISLEFNLSLTSNYDNNILSMITKDIKDYIENITTLQNIHMINITNYISNKYPDSIEYFEFVSTDNHTNWKHIYNTQEDDSSYYLSEYTPEFLNINNSIINTGNSSSIEPDIIINVV